MMLTKLTKKPGLPQGVLVESVTSGILIFMLHWRRQSAEHSLPSSWNVIDVVFYSQQHDLWGHVATHRKSIAVERSSLRRDNSEDGPHGAFP